MNTSWYRRFELPAKVAFIAIMLVGIVGYAVADLAGNSIFESALRVERITRMAQTYRTASDGLLICPAVASALKVDGDLSDWPPARTGATLAVGAPVEPAEGTASALGATVRTAWTPAGFYLSADIRDPAVTSDSASEDLVSGGTIQVTFETAPAGETLSEETAEDKATVFIVSRLSNGPAVFNATDDMRQLNGDGLAAVVDGQGRRTVEIHVPWSDLKPVTPHNDVPVGISVRLEGHDTAEDAEPPSVDTSGEHTRLVFGSISPKDAPTGYLRVVADAIHTGDPVDGVLTVDSPRPIGDVSLRLGIDSVGPDNTLRSITQVSQRLRLDQGINAFRLQWDSSGSPAGDYTISATALTGSSQLIALKTPVKVTPRQTTATVIAGYSQTLSNKAVLARIRKARETDPNAPLKFAVMGDPRDGDAIFRKALDDAAEDGAQFAMVLGDLVGSGRPSQYIRLAKILEKAPLPVLVCAGNHDYMNGGRVYYQRLFGSASYAFDLAGYHFILVDTGDRQLTAARLAWLEKELKSPLPKLVFTHTPPATIQKWAWHSFTRGADRFTALMEQYKPVRVFVSHIHAYDSATLNGIEYILTGGAGAPLYKELGTSVAAHNFVMVEAGPQGVADTVVKLGWQKTTRGGKQ